MPIAVSILGVTGKMGKNILAAVMKDPTVFIAGGAAHLNSAYVGVDLGNLIGSTPLNLCVLSDAKQALPSCHVAIDFSLRNAICDHVRAAQEAKKALVIGTTGLLDEDMDCIEKAAQDIPIIQSANYSLGIALCTDIVASLARTLFGFCRIDIFEAHHVCKKDRPSGTALALAHAMQAKKEIDIHSTRSGEVIGEHRVVFECPHECIEIKHIAHSRDVFVQGALLAAKLLIDKPAGLYTLKDLFTNEAFVKMGLENYLN
jgi:4-hydroxy-tetrahydrodipicolinate reductase